MELYTNLFESLLEKPNSLIGEKSITKMFIFLCGYQWCAKTDHSDDPLYSGFQNWIEARFQMGISHNWASVILFLEGGSEYRAFDRLKILWYEYKAEMENLNTQSDLI